MRSVDELVRKRLPPKSVDRVGALASQYEVSQHCAVAVGIRRTVAWAQAFAPAELVIPLRTGLPAWLGFQAVARGWKLRVIAAEDTLQRAQPDMLPLFLELWTASSDRQVVGSVAERDALVAQTVPIVTIRHILDLSVPIMGHAVVGS